MASLAMRHKARKVEKFEAPKPIRRRINTRTPAGTRSTVMVTVVHKEDPAKALLDRVGPISGDIVQFARILVAIYQPPIVTKLDSGLELPIQVSQEDLQEYLWQGKVGLIVAKGQLAYKDDENTKFHGVSNEIGDWVWFRPSDGIPCDVNEVFCRILSEREIIGRIPHPDYVW